MDIYVGNLNYNLTENEIQKLFEVFGEVLKVTLIINKRTGKSRGYGFVHMRNELDASRAVNELNERKVAGRRLIVLFSHSADAPEMPLNTYSDRQKEKYLSNAELKNSSKTSKKSYKEIDVDENGYIKIKFSQ